MGGYRVGAIWKYTMRVSYALMLWYVPEYGWCVQEKNSRDLVLDLVSLRLQHDFSVTALRIRQHHKSALQVLKSL
jgi:hypothetical protein